MAFANRDALPIRQVPLARAATAASSGPSTAIQTAIVRADPRVRGWTPAASARTLGSTFHWLLAGAVGCAIVAGVGVWVIDSQLKEILLIQSAAQATSLVRLGVLSHLTAQDFASPHTPKRLADINERLMPVLAPMSANGTGVLAVSLVALDRTIIYSGLPSTAGQQIAPSDDALMSAVLKGHIGAEVDSLSELDELSLGTLQDDVFEVFVPIVIDGTVVGAFAVYEDIPRFRSLRLFLWSVLVSGFVALVLTASSLSVRRVQYPDSRAAAELSPAPRRTPDALLTPREIEVLGLLAIGHSYRAVAADLTLSQETVRSHVKRILRKMGQPNCRAAAVAALRTGILQLVTTCG